MCCSFQLWWLLTTSPLRGSPSKHGRRPPMQGWRVGQSDADQREGVHPWRKLSLWMLCWYTGRQRHTGCRHHLLPLWCWDVLVVQRTQKGVVVASVAPRRWSGALWGVHHRNDATTWCAGAPPAWMSGALWSPPLSCGDLRQHDLGLFLVVIPPNLRCNHCHCQRQWDINGTLMGCMGSQPNEVGHCEAFAAHFMRWPWMAPIPHCHCSSHCCAAWETASHLPPCWSVVDQTITFNMFPTFHWGLFSTILWASIMLPLPPPNNVILCPGSGRGDRSLSGCMPLSLHMAPEGSPLLIASHSFYLV